VYKPRVCPLYAAFIRESDHEAIVNPSTATMMESNLTSEHARILFPKVATAAAKVRAGILQSAFALAAKNDDSATPAEREGAESVIREMLAQCAPSTYTKGLRVDCIAELPSAQLWIDVGIVHPTAASKLTQSMSFARQQHLAERVARGNRANNALIRFASPPVKAYQTVKDKKYEGMVKAACIDARAGKRVRGPRLAACIMSHLGELSPRAILFFFFRCIYSESAKLTPTTCCSDFNLQAGPTPVVVCDQNKLQNLNEINTRTRTHKLL
jgi:hypothetical protein